jgi:capsid protein
MGIPYELLTGDLKGVNFSSGRLGWLHFARRVDVWQWRMLIPQLCDQVWRWFMEAQVLLPAGVRDDVKAQWVPPRRDMVDPKAETDNVKDRVRNGLTTWPDALRELGVTDPKQHAQDIADSNALLDSLGLILDCDPRMVAAAGAASQTPPPEEKTDDGNSDTADDQQNA